MSSIAQGINITKNKPVTNAPIVNVEPKESPLEQLVNKLSKKNVEPFEAKINLNIPNKKVFEMLIDNADEDREELIKTIAKVAVSQIEIHKLQEYLTEEVSIFINNYYND
jgi:glutamate mutase epsilon subunit